MQYTFEYTQDNTRLVEFATSQIVERVDHPDDLKILEDATYTDQKIYTTRFTSESLITILRFSSGVILAVSGNDIGIWSYAAIPTENKT